MSTWQSMMRISDAQIEEIKANPNLLDVFLYTAGMRNRMEQLANIQDQGTHDIFQTENGLVVMPKNGGVRLLPPAVPWYRRWWNAITGNRSQAPKPIRIERPDPPPIPSHWPSFESEDRYNLDQEFDLIYYLFSDCELPGTYPLNFMLVPKHRIGTPENGFFYFHAAEIGEITTALDLVSEDTLRQRYENKERLEMLGCGHATEWEGTEYEEVIDDMISGMRQFLDYVRSKESGILVMLN